MYEGFTYRQWATIWTVLAVAIATFSILSGVFFYLAGQDIPILLWFNLPLCGYATWCAISWDRDAKEDGQ